jgi:hypothetical protein
MYEWIPFSRQLRLGDALCPVGGYELRIIDPNDSKMVQRDRERNNPYVVGDVIIISNVGVQPVTFSLSR